MIISFVLLFVATLPIPTAAEEAAVLHPRLRKHLASSIFTAMANQEKQVAVKSQQQQQQQPKQKERWTGDEVYEILLQIQEQRTRNRSANSGKSFLDRILSFFTPSAHESVDKQKQRQILNNCFFTPMNCRVAPSRRGMAANRGGGRGGEEEEGTKMAPMVFMISDEEKAQLLAKHGHRLRHWKPTSKLEE